MPLTLVVSLTHTHSLFLSPLQVFAGGSAGLIWIFDAGHSDSADPASFKVADHQADRTQWYAYTTHLHAHPHLGVCQRFSPFAVTLHFFPRCHSPSGMSLSFLLFYLCRTSPFPSPVSPFYALTSRKYLRCPALGIIPGLVCPHHVRVFCQPSVFPTLCIV